MNVVRLITQKRDGGEVAPDDLTALVDAYTAGDVPDYQMAAFLMAAFVRGLGDAEAAALTRAMLHSGRVLDLSDVPGAKVDKHSTGGVGDKVSLVLAPLVAACGVPVPMISGRGLGHTGGTLDKLEAIPGFRTDLSIDEYRDVLGRVGTVMIGQTAEIAPADKKIYALRDVTGTVESIPLIAASILSKKLAEGIDALVLDVKCGRGAFMKDEAQARRLAETLVGVAEREGTPAVALLTRMDVPLGRAVGNGPETAEAVSILRDETPTGGACDDTVEVTVALAGEMLALGGAAPDAHAGREQARAALADGSALATFRALVEAQDGDASVLDHPARLMGEPVATVEADRAGTVADVDALALGYAAVALGAGRARKEDAVDPKAGFVLNKRPGEPVEAGEPLAFVYASDPDRADTDAVRAAFTVSDATPPRPAALVLDRYAGGAWDGRAGGADGSA
ncbi:thymidine phosphorylase [Rubrivirga litoralis]|uniref:thymidine phosphorylase n=1 Tax=Rubrivirga litoralis TaxID=3075598 RepID=A0ABU3BU81_9BACT|nr:thymidine phosphorylase [Rubrivirga sp. F394]MDT0632851.1 thymidine phosphorylase [Rubrivirga sp. F394]